MVTYEGYCRPLKQKVEFVVESIDSLETKRGIKWSVKGNYEGHKISTFTNQDTAQDLLSKMSDHPPQEIEVFGAEIAFQEAEDEDEELSSIEIKNQRDLQDLAKGIGAEDTRSELTAKHYKKDGSLDLRYKICREIAASEKKNAESKTVDKVEKKTEKVTKQDKKVIDEVEDVATDVAVDSVMDAESFDAETYNKVYRAEPNAIIFEENIPAEVWNIMGPDAQGHYLSTRDESVLIAPCCGVTKAELRIDNDANMDCPSCCFSGDDFHPRWWADKPKPEVRLTHGAEEAPMDLTYGNTATVPVDVYYKFMLELPPTVSATVTDDGLSMILGFHNQYADLIDALIEGYSPYQDAGNPKDTLYAEDTLSFVPSDFNPTSFEAESDRLNSHYSNTLKFTDEELDKLGELYMAAETFNAEMTCPPATKDVAINTKNRNATIKNYGYGPLNVEEPGDFWEKIAKQWDTTEKAAKKSKCGNCVAFDRSPRMKDCMPGETSDGEGVLGYCWMHHFKCHSARTCDTWAKGGPITTDKVSEGWQERAFAKPKASKTATEAGKATAKAAESFDDEDEYGRHETIKLRYKLVDAIEGMPKDDAWDLIMDLDGEYGTGLTDEEEKDWNDAVDNQDLSKATYLIIVYRNYISGKKAEKLIEIINKQNFDTESYDVEFEEWGKQEMLTHGKDVSFKEWLKEESKSHGDVPLMDWAEHEEESHDERYEAESFEADFQKMINMDKRWVKCHFCNFTWHNSVRKECLLCGDEPINNDAEEESFEAETIKTGVICGDNGCSGELLETEYGKASKVHCNKCDYSEIMEWDAESFEADATSCFQCGRFGYDDEMMRIDYGHLCARCANPDVDFSKIMRAEESPKITKKLIGLLGIGALGAVLAPKEIRKLFDKFKKS